MIIVIRLQREAFDVAAEAALLTRGRTDIGAVVTFTGYAVPTRTASRSRR